MSRYLFLAVFCLFLSLVTFSSLLFASDAPMEESASASASTSLSSFRSTGHWYIGLGAGAPVKSNTTSLNFDNGSSITLTNGSMYYAANFFGGYDIALSQHNHLLIDVNVTPIRYYGSTGLYVFDAFLNLRLQRYLTDNFNITVSGGLGSTGTFGYSFNAFFQSYSAAYNVGAGLEYVFAMRHGVAINYTFVSVIEGSTIAGISWPSGSAVLPRLASVSIPNTHLLMLNYRFMF